MSIRSYSEMKTRIEINRKIIAIITAKPGDFTPEDIAQWKAEMQNDFKNDCRDFYKYQSKYRRDPLSVPVTNDKKVWRTVSYSDDTATDFIIIPDNGQTDEDIETFVHETVYCPSFYDFPTGREVTFRWHYTRTRSGIAIVHERGIDW